MLMRPTITVALGLMVLFMDHCPPKSAYSAEYQTRLRQQGYEPLQHPRANLGVGTLVPADSTRNLIIARQDECFPGLEKHFADGEIVLLDSSDYKNLDISTSGSYSPGGGGWLGKIAGTFGFKNSKTFEVKYDQTRAINLSVEGLRQYLTEVKLSESCKNSLNDPKNKLILSMARVDGMTYTFEGNRDVNASVDVNALAGQVAAAGNIKYEHNNKDSLTIKTPMYVAYVSYSLGDLQIGKIEGAAATYYQIRSVDVQKSTGPMTGVE